MPARVCVTCEIAFPVEAVRVCPVCGTTLPKDDTVSFQWDWEEQVAARRVQREEAKGYTPDAETTRVIANRAKRLQDAGLDWDTALALAARRADGGGFQVDVTDFEHQVERGCPPETAARILG